MRVIGIKKEHLGARRRNTANSRRNTCRDKEIRYYTECNICNKIKGNRETGSNKEEDSDAVYILAKELAYNVLNARKTELKTALGKAKGADIKRFADELKNHHDDIDKKLCKDGSASDVNTAGKCTEKSNKTGLAAAMGTEGAKHWPKISADDDNTGTAYKKDSTEKISGDMIELTPDEKEKTARLFARTVEVRCSIIY